MTPLHGGPPGAECNQNEHVTIDTNIDENLLIAAIKGDNEHVEILLNKGVNVNANTKSDDGSTVLIQASISGSVDLVKLLLDKGAKINKKAMKLKQL